MHLCRRVLGYHLHEGRVGKVTGIPGLDAHKLPRNSTHAIETKHRPHLGTTHCNRGGTARYAHKHAVEQIDLSRVFEVTKPCSTARMNGCYVESPGGTLIVDHTGVPPHDSPGTEREPSDTE